MQTPVRFVTTRDGVRIACCTHGHGQPLVFIRGWISHLELLWEDQAFRSYFETLARHFRLVRYDARGNGLSDWKVPEIDLDALVLDVEAVMAELPLSGAVLYGATFGGPIAIAYAARHPDRVDRLILDGTYARGAEIASPERQASILAMLRDFPEAGFRILSHLTHPEPEEAPYRKASREQVSAEVAAQLYTLCYKIDVSPLLPSIRAPTLVMHRRGSLSIPFRLGRQLAAAIPGARFAALEGSAHNSWEGGAASALAAVGDFLGVDLALPTPAAAKSAPSLQTILFTDMEGSTPATQRLGDAAAQELVRAHNAVVREALRAHGGTEIKHTGDGIMASFLSASRAIECAAAMQKAFAEGKADVRALGHAALPEPLRVRIGLNAGEPVAEEAQPGRPDLFGAAVQLAARICTQADPGQILVSDVVRQLAAGKGFLFSDRGDVALRGFEDPVRLYEVRWQE